jgi:predicted RNA-binding protein associated with RNAse of E/G family
MQSGDVVMVHKLDHRGNEVWHYGARLIERTATHLTLEAFFDRENLTVGGLPLTRGDRFVETYFTDHWYNIFAVHEGGDGPLKGWYCNIARPARIEPGHLYAEDLALDVIVDRRGHWTVIDQDEFEALDITPEDRALARHALDELQHLAAAHEGPFAGLG